MDLMALLSINSTVCIDFWYWVTCSKCSAGGILACIVDQGDVVLPEVGGSDDVALEQVHPVNLLSRRSARNLSVKMCSNEAAVPGSKNSRGGRVHNVPGCAIFDPKSISKKKLVFLVCAGVSLYQKQCREAGAVFFSKARAEI